jgi:hypothetical protein
MKLRRLLVALLVLFFLNFVSPNANAGGGSPELYSWREGDQWGFSILGGTNSLKDIGQVKDPRCRMNLDRLIERMSFDGYGDELTWWQHKGLGMKKDQCDLAMPPADVVARIKAVAQKYHHRLNIFAEAFDVPPTEAMLTDEVQWDKYTKARAAASLKAHYLDTVAQRDFLHGKYTEAEPLYKQAVAVEENVLGPNHADVSECLEQYATFLRQTHREKDADKVEAQARAIQANIFGKWP